MTQEIDFAVLVDDTIEDITSVGAPPLPGPMIDAYVEVLTEGMRQAERDGIRLEIAALVNYRLTLFWLKRTNSARVA